MGKPAFPTPERMHDDWQGMDLRDYFAAAYMKGATAKYGIPKGGNSKVRATQAYQMADAMMEARHG